MVDNKITILIILAVLLFIAALFPNGAAAQSGNKFLIDYMEDDLYIELNFAGQRKTVSSSCALVTYFENEISIADGPVFSGQSIVWDDIEVPYELLKVRKVERISDDRVLVEFQIKDEPPRRRIPTDMFNAFKPAIIDSEIFVRGDLINVGADVELYGEVADNLISLFGDVTLHSRSLVRENVVVICGRVYRHEDSQVYGQIVSMKGWQEGGRKYGSRRGYYREIEFLGSFSYNRVDGLGVNIGLKYEDPDHIFPSVSGSFGYAFEAERTRYDLTVSQRIFNKYALEPYGSLYRETATEDDWIAGKNENTVYALLVKEDFRDYYEKEGGKVGIKLHIGDHNKVDFAYSYDRLDWMDAHPRLWSLFGQERFRRNFSTVPLDLLDQYRSDFESKLSLFTVTYTFDRRDNIYDPWAGWYGEAMYEKAGGDLKGDLTFSRWRFSLVRYQPLNEYLGFNLRTIYAGSSDRIPIFKKYYLGGLRSLRGYDIKEFFGDQMFLGNIEYVVSFNAYSRGMIFFDIGKVIGQDDDIFDDGEFKSDIGLGVSLSPGFRVELARALDDSDADLKFWVTFGKSF